MVKLTSSDPTWRDTLEGLFGSVLRGGTLGFSDDLSSDLKHRTEGFESRNPVTATLANIAGAMGGTMLGSSEEALAGRGLGWLAKLMPSRTADIIGTRLITDFHPLMSKIGSTVVPSVISNALEKAGTAVVPSAVRNAASVVRSALEGTSASIVPSMLSSALQGGAYAYNTAADSDPDPMQKALWGATLGGASTGVINQAERLVGPTVRAILRGSTAGRDRALKLAGRVSGMSNQGLIDRLKELPGTARVYDVAPVSLGDRGLLGAAVAQHQPLMNAAREAAVADTAGLVERGQAIRPKYWSKAAADDTAKLAESEQVLEDDHLKDSVPGSLGDFIDSAEAHRSEATKPLYDIADNASINLAGHPDLLKHLVLDNDYARYLAKSASNPVTDVVDAKNINRFLENRSGVVNAGNDAVKSYRNVPIPDQELRDIHSAAINDHIARSGADFSLPRPLVRGYLDDLVANRPPISRAYSKLEPNPYDKVDRLVDSVKRAISEVTPEDRAAQQAYRKLSVPLNEADLAQSIEKSGGSKRADSLATREYIAALDKLRAAAKAEGLPDNSRLLTGFTLDEAIQKKARHDAIEIPQAIVDKVRGELKTRADAVYGDKLVDARLSDATEIAQEIDNRRGLVNMGVAKGGGDVKPSTVMRHGFMAVADHIYRSIVHGGTDKRMAEFLQLHPEKAIAHIEEYMLKHPEGKLPDYEKYLNSVLGSYVGGGEHPEVAADPVHSLKWDYDSQQMVDRLTGLPPVVAADPSTDPKWRWDYDSQRMVRVR